MISPIVLATPEEVERFRTGSDYTPNSRLLKFENNFAVLRPTTEIDPIYFDPEAPPHKRALMLWGLEQILRFGGNSEYYFNVNTQDTAFQEAVKKMGCVQVSNTPEYRFKKVL